MKKISCIGFMVVIMTSASVWAVEPASPVVCPMDAKICPDGSSVNRTGPNCEFAPCPGTIYPDKPDGGVVEDGNVVSEGQGEMAPWTPSQPDSSQTGRLEGRIVLGPTSPLARAGEPNQRPVAGVIALVGQDGKEIKVTSNEQGIFQAEIPPGTYEIQLVSATVPNTSLKPQSVTVEAGRTASVTVMIDTGIR